VVFVFDQPPHGRERLLVFQPPVDNRPGQPGEPPKTVSERLGHASITVTLGVYGHVMPGDQKRVASRFAALIGEE